jgi:hypothetical protein
MRTTITLDDDVAALIEQERARTGETFKAVVNRLLRRSSHSVEQGTAPELPKWPGRPLLDLTDVSAVLALLDEERRSERGIP